MRAFHKPRPCLDIKVPGITEPGLELMLVVTYERIADHGTYMGIKALNAK